jgi:hypothetical protein
MKLKSINKLSHVGDILAIPFWLLLAWYFYNIEHKNLLEYFLLFYVLGAFLCDTFFTYRFLKNY